MFPFSSLHRLKMQFQHSDETFRKTCLGGLVAFLVEDILSLKCFKLCFRLNYLGSIRSFLTVRKVGFYIRITQRALEVVSGEFLPPPALVTGFWLLFWGLRWQLQHLFRWVWGKHGGNVFLRLPLRHCLCHPRSSSKLGFPLLDCVRNNNFPG